jgi:uncharacterized membrane protein HdeD (DUF308 family)
MNNYFLRFLAGLNSIIIGLFLLICYLQRDKKNTWSQMYSSINESLLQIAKLFQSERKHKKSDDIQWLLFAIFCIVMGIIAICFGVG